MHGTLSIDPGHSIDQVRWFLGFTSHYRPSQRMIRTGFGLRWRYIDADQAMIRACGPSVLTLLAAAAFTLVVIAAVITVIAMSIHSWRWLAAPIAAFALLGVWYALILGAVTAPGTLPVVVWDRRGGTIELPHYPMTIDAARVIRFEWVPVKFAAAGRTLHESHAVLCVRQEAGTLGWIALCDAPSSGMRESLQSLASAMNVPYVRTEPVEVEQ